MLESSLSVEEFRMIVNTDSSEWHFTVGRSIRNDWGLWADGPLKRWFNSIGITHPDDMSGTILKALRRKVRGIAYTNIDLMDDVKKYQNYWKTASKLNSGTINITVSKNQYGETELSYEQ